MKPIGRLTWRREPSETGLARVCQAPRGAILKWNGVDVAHVGASMRIGGRCDGWHWYSLSTAGIASHNSAAAGATIGSLEEAKAQCEAYVRAQLAAHQSEAAQ